MAPQYNRFFGMLHDIDSVGDTMRTAFAITLGLATLLFLAPAPAAAQDLGVERFGARRVSHGALFGFIAITMVMFWSASRQPQSLAEFVVLISLAMAMLGFIGANFSSIAMQPFYDIAGAASSAHTALRMGTGAILGSFIGYQYDGTAQPLALAMLACGLLALAIVLFSERGRLFKRPNV